MNLYILTFCLFPFLICAKELENVTVGQDFEIKGNELIIPKEQSSRYEQDEICSYVSEKYDNEKEVLFKDFKFVSYDAIAESKKIVLNFPDKPAIYYRVFWADGEYYMDKINVEDITSKDIINEKLLRSISEKNPISCKKANLMIMQFIGLYNIGHEFQKQKQKQK